MPIERQHSTANDFSICTALLYIKSYLLDFEAFLPIHSRIYTGLAGLCNCLRIAHLDVCHGECLLIRYRLFDCVEYDCSVRRGRVCKIPKVLGRKQET